MNFRPFALLAALVLALPAQADVVQLKDGKELRGSVMLKTEEGTLLLQLADGGMRRLAKDEVRTLKPEGGSGYLRFSSYRGDWSRLEVLCRSFQSKNKSQRVTLAGAVHIGDMLYYRSLQRLLDAHDVVLYEGVGATPRRNLDQLSLPTREGRQAQLQRPFRKRSLRRSKLSALDPLTQLQTGMASQLDLGFQAEGIDYSHSWWVPADVTVEQMKSTFSSSKASLFSEMLRSSGDPELNQATQEIMLRTMTRALNSLNTSKPMKTVLKEAFAELLVSQLGLLSPTPKSADKMATEGAKEGESLFQDVLILSRNKVVMQRLKEALQARGARTIAIFYGAGHNADLEDRIVKLGFTAVRDEWLPAWEMKSPGK